MGSASHLRQRASPNGPSVCMLLSGKIECEIKIIEFLIICILFTTQYNQNIHNEGQRQIEHTDLNTET